MNNRLHPRIERRPRVDELTCHDAPRDVARALGGIGALPECSEQFERMRGAMDQLNFRPC